MLLAMLFALSATNPPACRPSLAVGDLPVKSCYLFAKYADFCEPAPTWKVTPARDLSYWTLPLQQIEGPHAFIARLEPTPGLVTVTVTGYPGGATRSALIEVLPGGSCVQWWRPEWRPRD